MSMKWPVGASQRERDQALAGGWPSSSVTITSAAVVAGDANI